MVYFLSVDWFRFLTLSLTVERRFEFLLLAGGPEITSLKTTQFPMCRYISLNMCNNLAYLHSVTNFWTRRSRFVSLVPVALSLGPLWPRLPEQGRSELLV